MRTQLAARSELGPPPGALRGSGVAAIALTNADIDHCAGLLVLREGGAPPIYGTEAMRRSLTEGLSILPALSAYGPVDWRDLSGAVEITDADGDPIGVQVTARPLPGQAPLYVRGRTDAPPEGDHCLGLAIRVGDATVAYAPGVRALDDPLRAWLADADVVLIDGTFSVDDELTAQGMSERTATDMGHVPLLGDAGTLAFLERLDRPRRVLVHINNTNPIWDDPALRERVAHADVEVGYDGLEIPLR